MLLTEAQLLETLDRLQTRDEVLLEVAAEVGAVLSSWKIDKTPRLFVVDLAEVADDPPPIYDTPNCVALALGPCIVINERFLLEIEGAIRAFGGFASLRGCPFARSENDMFALIRRLEGRLPSYLRRMRRVDAGGSRERDSREELKLVTLFFVAHEFGHLRQAEDGRQFDAYLDPSLPLERQLDVSVVKMCRHLEEFREHGFSLDGEQGDSESDEKIRAEERRMRADDHQRMLRWFDNEADADEVGATLLIDYLKAAPIETSLAFIRGLFAASMLGWFRDLMHYSAALGIEPYDANTLALMMVETKRNYVGAASLFGSAHRFTLLRAVLVTERLLDESPRVFGYESVDDEQLRHSMSEAGAKDMLLRRLMDTGVKFATMGCANGWLLKLEAEQGRKPFLMTFYSLGYELEQIYGPLQRL